MVVGLPLMHQCKLYNVAAVLCRGAVEGLVPKHSIPNYSEFYEQRHFTSGAGLDMEPVELLGQTTMFGGVQVFSSAAMPDFAFGVEICEDLWVPEPPSTRLAQAGATVIVNLSASDEIIGKTAYRRDLVRQQSARLLCAYAYADAGFGESTQDLVFSGHDLIACLLYTSYRLHQVSIGGWAGLADTEGLAAVAGVFLLALTVPINFIMIRVHCSVRQ